MFNAIAGTFITDEGKIVIDGENTDLQTGYLPCKVHRTNFSGSYEGLCSFSFDRTKSCHSLLFNKERNIPQSYIKKRQRIFQRSAFKSLIWDLRTE